METCKADPAIQRVEVEGFKFPLGAYPVEPMKPKAGYTLQFEPADGGEHDADWEEWPDRYVFDAVIPADRVEPLCRMLFSLLPGRIYPILDVLGNDAYREIDPYIAYDLIAAERFVDNVRKYRDFLFEDGLIGFGAMGEEPFYYVFVDEHKIITIRAQTDLKEKVEKVLQAFDLEVCEEPAGADAAAHEHRSVLLMPDDRPDLLGPDEIVERLRDQWQLLLNVDPDSNLDDEGKTLGATLWRCIARCERDAQPPKYAEVMLRAGSLRQAEETTFDAIEEISNPEEAWDDVIIVASIRVKPDQMPKLKGAPKKAKGDRGGEARILAARFLES
ncbi:hypothetical protein PHYC_01086 [Phycisphaerales bacterium]|nr:hypothetical protein PHYC_01086 [Phycisphaerales bacterium]